MFILEIQLDYFRKRDSMHSYLKIKKIRDDLQFIINKLQDNSLVEQYVNGLQDNLKYYDEVLNKIGPGNYNTDPTIEIGFIETKQLIQKLMKINL